MKIISKFKDYYDYKVAEYGIDEVLVYDRRRTYPEHTPSLLYPDEKSDEPLVYLVHLYVGNQLFYLFKSDEKIYTPYDLALRNEDSYYHFRFSDDKVFRCIHYNQKYHISFCNKDLPKTYSQTINRKDKLKHLQWWSEKMNLDLLKEPIVLVQYYRNSNNRREELGTHIIVNPNLSAMGIFLDPDFVWKSLVEFLSFLKTEKEISSDEVPNDEKIINKGFDKKTSFRPKMKE